jgi:hypothetical protein
MEINFTEHLQLYLAWDWFPDEERILNFEFYIDPDEISYECLIFRLFKFSFSLMDTKGCNCDMNELVNEMQDLTDQLKKKGVK